VEEVQEWLEKPKSARPQNQCLSMGVLASRLIRKFLSGILYMMKLSHMVDDKFTHVLLDHTLSFTQQPLGGKAQFGGQRFGEMEVWHSKDMVQRYLQEILTVKSDDVLGRAKVYESIVKGENLPEPNIPESFNVLVRELQGLGLEVKIE